MAPTWAVPGLLLFKRSLQNRMSVKGPRFFKETYETGRA